MPRPEKVQKVEEAKKDLQDSVITIVADYRGLDVAQVTELRSRLSESNVKCKVMKNTFVRLAAEQSDIEISEGLLSGPSMFVFSVEDPVAPAKILSEFAKENEALEIKGGLLDKKEISDADVKGLAKLPSREQLLTQIVGLLNTPIQGIVNVLAGPQRNLVTVLDAIAKQKGE